MTRHTITQAPGSQQPPTTLPDPLRSIHDLGCARAAISAEVTRLYDIGVRHLTTIELLEKQESALDDLISTRPAMTLADAAVQIGVACTLVSLLAACQWQDQPERLEELHDNLERLLLSAMPFVAQAAGLDVVAMGWHEHVMFRAQRFGLAEAVA